MWLVKKRIDVDFIEYNNKTKVYKHVQQKVAQVLQN
jgi:hypothetical protein